MTMWPSSIAAEMRPGVTSMILALPCTESVITPACEPVNDRAVKPRSEIAIATSAIEIRSPAVRSMSSSRAGGSGLTPSARSSSSSVVSPMAETATTTSCPAFFTSTMRRATRLTAEASASDEPPYFCTTMPTALPSIHCSVTSSTRPPRAADDSTWGQATGSPVSNTASAAAISSVSLSNSASRRSWATTDCNARSAALARMPQSAT